MTPEQRHEEDIRLVNNIHWKSDDKDNMEFITRISCYQLDAFRRLLWKEETHE